MKPEQKNRIEDRIFELQKVFSNYTPEKKELSRKSAIEINQQKDLYTIIMLTQNSEYLFKINPNKRPESPKNPYKNHNGANSSQDYRNQMKEYLSFWLNEIPETLSQITYETLANYIENNSK